MVVMVVMVVMMMVMVVVGFLRDGFRGQGLGALFHSRGGLGDASDGGRISLTQQTEGGCKNTRQANLG